jgi:hypothetical protein
MRENKKNLGLKGMGIVGILMIAARKLASGVGGRQNHNVSESPSEHPTGAWENQELWRRRLSI